MRNIYHLRRLPWKLLTQAIFLFAAVDPLTNDAAFVILLLRTLNLLAIFPVGSKKIT
jgi:hypothetical protein